MIQVFRTRNRQAFTLVELLVVIAIIAVLAALSAWGVFAMIGSQQRRNTESSMRVINKLLQDRWAAVIADAKKETPSQAVFIRAGNNKERAQVIWIKVRLAEAFPATYGEANPANLSTIVNNYIPLGMRKAHFAKYQAALGSQTGGGAGESSACLLMALKTLASDGVSVEDQLKPFVKDTDGDGVPELVDGWGKPLKFLRFPTVVTTEPGGPISANPAKAAGGRTAKFADPVDPEGTLINATWYNAPPPLPANNDRRIFEAQFHPVGPQPVPPAVNPPFAFYTIPVVASAGKDGVMDIANDGTETLPGAKDNIVNFRLRGD